MLNLRTILQWIMNAVIYAVVFCLLFFNVMRPTFLDYGLYEMGTMIYVGLVLSLQLKVSFIHHLWTQVHFWSMFISVFGIFLVMYVLNAPEEENYDFYWVVNWLYSNDNAFWLYGVFCAPIFCVMIDFIGHSYYVVFAPTDEMRAREDAFFRFLPSLNDKSMSPQESLADTPSKVHALRTNDAVSKL